MKPIAMKILTNKPTAEQLQAALAELAFHRATIRRCDRRPSVRKIAQARAALALARPKLVA